MAINSSPLKIIFLEKQIQGPKEVSSTESPLRKNGERNGNRRGTLKKGKRGILIITSKEIFKGQRVSQQPQTRLRENSSREKNTHPQVVTAPHGPDGKKRGAALKGGAHESQPLADKPVEATPTRGAETAYKKQ